MIFGIKRFEVIDHREKSDNFGRRLVIGSLSENQEFIKCELSIQDDGQTIKIFLSDSTENKHK